MQRGAPVVWIGMSGVDALDHAVDELGFAVFVDQPLVVEGAGAVPEVGTTTLQVGAGIRKLPDVSAANLRIGSEELQGPADQIGLVVFAEQPGLPAGVAVDACSAKLGHKYRGVLRAIRLAALVESLEHHLEIDVPVIPSAIIVNADDVK